MKHKLVPFSVTTAALLALLLGAAPTAFAQSAAPKVGGGSPATVIAKGDADIAMRITSLNTLITTVQGLKHVSDTDKSTFVGQIQSEISGLNGQKTKLDADTTVSAARTDRAAIFTQFRIYMLYIPKTRILVATDAMSDVDSTMSTIASELQARISLAQSQGKDVSALTAAMTDLQNKIADAKTQYSNAENTVSGLQPDQGNQSVIQSNQAALQSARGMIKTGNLDLRTGRTDITTIWTALKAMHLKTATPSASSVTP